MNDPILYDPFGRRAPSMTRQDVASGVGIVGGFFKPLQNREPDELANGMQRHETFRTMTQTDSYIAETLRIISLPLLCQAHWTVESAFDVEFGADLTPEQETAKDMANLFGCNLFGIETDKYGTDFRQRSHFSQFVRECLMSLPHGFSLFHKTAKSVEGKLVYDRLHWLEPSSIYRWDVNRNDDLLGVWRNYIAPDMTPVTGEYVPVEELFLIVWEGVGARYEGCPFVRSQFGPWKRKEFIQRCKMIAVQQASVGQPWASYDPTLFASSGDIKDNEQRIEDFLQSSLGSGLGTAYLLVPNPSFKADYLRLDAAALEAFDKLTTHENLGEAHGGSSKSMMLGEIQGGSRATAQTQRSTESVVAMALAQIMGEQIQRGFNNVKGLIDEGTGWNANGVRRLPKVVVDGVDPDDAARNSKTIAVQATAGLIKYRPSLEKKLLEQAGVHLSDDEFDTDLHPELLLPTGAAGGGFGGDDPSAAPGARGNTSPKGAPKRPVAAAARLGAAPEARDVREGRRIELRLSLDRMMRTPAESPEEARAQGLGRPPSQFESKVCTLGAVSSVLTNGGDQMAAVLRRITARMTEDIIARIESGKVTRGTLSGMRRTRPKGENEMIAAVQERFLSIAAIGRKHANEELARQIDLAGRVTSGAISASGLMFAEGDVPPADGPNMLPAGAAIPLEASFAKEISDLIAASGGVENVGPTLAITIAEESRVTSDIPVGSIWGRLWEEAINAYNAAIRGGLVEGDALKEVERVLLGLSPARPDITGRQLAEVAYNVGRDWAAKDAAANGQAQWVVRTEVLDTRTCQSCKQLDGIYLKIGTPEYEQYVPPAKCFGGDLCRGFITIVSNEFAKVLDAS